MVLRRAVSPGPHVFKEGFEMTRRFFAGFVVLVAVCVTHATHAAVSITLQPVPISAAAIADDPSLANAQALDLMFTTDQPVTFFTTGMFAQAAPGGSFYQHPFGSVAQSPPALVTLFPSLAFDTYLTAVPNATLQLAHQFVGQTLQFDTQTLNRIWDSRLPLSNSFIGTAPIARITYFGGTPSGFGLVFVPSTNEQVNFVIPEPGSLLIATPFIAACVLRRSR
jgi:hypothetical protein